MDDSPESLSRTSVTALDAILGKAFPALDDGFVRVVDYMGSDASVIQAARVSYGAGTTKVQDDRHLIRYLMRHRHTTPFEMCEIKLHIRCPMDTWRQWIRHRTASVNEYSTRYSLAIDSAQLTGPGNWRLQSASSKQGSVGGLPESVGSELSQAELDLHSHARSVYDHRITKGVAREQARKDLPLSTYTEAYWKIDLHNLLHFLELRMAPHAQWEIRQFANIIGTEIVNIWCPVTWEAFNSYRLSSVSLSEFEKNVIKALAMNDKGAALVIAHHLGWCDESGSYTKANRERTECEEKIEQLGFQPPWTRR